MIAWLQTSLPLNAPVPPWLMAWRLCLAALIGWIVSLIYRRLHRDGTVIPTFPPTLALLCILIATVTQVIGDSIAKAFSLVGALSIVRFRTSVQDTQDTAFVIFAVILGMAIGSDHLWITLIGLIVVGVAAHLMKPRSSRYGKPPPERSDYKLSMRIESENPPETITEPVFARFVHTQEILALSSGKQGASLDVTYRVQLITGAVLGTFVSELSRTEGIQNVELKRL